MTLVYQFALILFDFKLRVFMHQDCEQTIPYIGEVCNFELSSLQMCLSGSPSSPPASNIPASIDQQQKENYVKSYLSYLEPNSECFLSARRFLCRYTFGLCDNSGDFHEATRKECMFVRDRVCSREWRIGQTFLDLPDCEELPDTGKCIGKEVAVTWCSYVSGQQVCCNKIDCLSGRLTFRKGQKVKFYFEVRMLVFILEFM